jgi:hypothetical protein
MFEPGVQKWAEQEPDGSSGYMVFDLNKPDDVEIDVTVDGGQVRVDWERVEQEAER